jgi:hypothetical protein
MDVTTATLLAWVSQRGPPASERGFASARSIKLHFPESDSRRSQVTMIMRDKRPRRAHRTTRGGTLTLSENLSAEHSSVEARTHARLFAHRHCHCLTISPFGTSAARVDQGRIEATHF